MSKLCSLLFSGGLHHRIVAANLEFRVVSIATAPGFATTALYLHAAAAGNFPWAVGKLLLWLAQHPADGALPMLEAIAVIPKVHRVVLKKDDPASSLGIALDPRAAAGKALGVKQISNSGMIPNWNQYNPKESVEEGDYILSVDDVEGDAKALSEAVKAVPEGQRFELKVGRQVRSGEFLSPPMWKLFTGPGRKTFAGKHAFDSKMAADLWEFSEQACGVEFNVAK